MTHENDRIVSEGHESSLRDKLGKRVSEPHMALAVRPCGERMASKTMDSDDADVFVSDMTSILRGENVNT